MNRLIWIVFVLITSLPIATASYSEDKKPNRIWACVPVLDGELFLDKWFKNKPSFVYEGGNRKMERFYVKLYNDTVRIEWVDTEGSSLGKPLSYNVGTYQAFGGKSVATLGLYEGETGFVFEQKWHSQIVRPSSTDFRYTIVELAGSRFWRTQYVKLAPNLEHRFSVETANCKQIF